jgi:predicted dehydrogenase
MKYALIGCGRVSKNHIKAATINNLEIVALCDIIPEKAQKLIDDFSLSDVKIFTDYKKMISETKPDFVAIATDSGLHAEIAIYCAENKINFIVEKPIAMSIQDADRIIVLNEGRIESVGTHEELLKISPIYQEVYNTQVKGGSEDGK